MKNSATAMSWLLPVIALSVLLTGCANSDRTLGGENSADGGASVTVDDPGYKAIGAGAYNDARSEFEPRQAKTQHDPYLELDLGVSYQGLGRMDLAEGLYRGAMADGTAVKPPFVTFDRDKGKTIAEIACENIGIGNHTGSCAQIEAHRPLPAPVASDFMVFFDFDQSNLKDASEQIVTEAVKAAKASGATKIIITGHTDTVGSDSYNQGLSERRADTVKSEMVEEGLSDNTIAVEAKSFHDLLVPTGPGVREPQNRRAVIHLDD